MNNSLQEKVKQAAGLIRKSRFTTAYTGAGISAESGIPPFRGKNGIWEKYDPSTLDLNHFLQDPTTAWKTIKEIFYDFFGKAKPNRAHLILSMMEQRGLVKRIITQNIDNLHQEAGSKLVYDFHGNSKKMICLDCLMHYPAAEINLDHLPPTCRQCGGLLKPDFVFFGEGIPEVPLNAAFDAAIVSDVFLIIGTTGQVVPANQIPFMAKQNGARIIEVNPEKSAYTEEITDIFLKGKATEIMEMLATALFPSSLEDDKNSIDEDLKIHGQ